MENWWTEVFTKLTIKEADKIVLTNQTQNWKETKSTNSEEYEKFRCVVRVMSAEANVAHTPAMYLKESQSG